MNLYHIYSFKYDVTGIQSDNKKNYQKLIQSAYSIIANRKCKIFQPNLLVRKFSRKRTIFRKPPSYSLENLRKLLANLLPAYQSEKPPYAWCQLKRFSSIGFSCSFNVHLNYLISNASAILCLNTFLRKLLPIVLKSLIPGDL